MGKYFIVTDVSDSTGEDFVISTTKQLESDVEKVLKNGFGSVWSFDEISEFKKQEIEKAIKEMMSRIRSIFNRAGRSLVEGVESGEIYGE